MRRRALSAAAAARLAYFLERARAITARDHSRPCDSGLGDSYAFDLGALVAVVDMLSDELRELGVPMPAREKSK